MASETHHESAPPSGRARRDSGATRKKVIDSAVACILEKGYYKASSNEIARYSGLTWGVIQYHFGTREKLMLAVLKEEIQRLIEHTEGVILSGETTRQYIDSFYQYLLGYFGRPEYLAVLEINLNLIRDPNTSDEVRRENLRLYDTLTSVYAQTRFHDRFHNVLLESLRGLILAHTMRSDTQLTIAVDEEEDFRFRSEALMDALALYLDTHSELQTCSEDFTKSQLQR
jgi:AcrR family transcriptional regulator